MGKGASLEPVSLRRECKGDRIILGTTGPKPHRAEALQESNTRGKVGFNKVLGPSHLAA